MQGGHVRNRKLSSAAKGREKREEKLGREGSRRGEIKEGRCKGRGRGRREGERWREKPLIEGKDFIIHEEFHLFLHNELKKE